MKKFKAITLTLCLGIVMAGCNNTQKGAAIGTGGGAVLGAIIGKMAGNTAVGAALGGAIGAGKAKKEAEAVKNAQVQQVTDANGLQAVKVTFDSGILFGTGSSTLAATAKTSLQQFSQVLKNNSDCDVAIHGYTDNQGWKNSTPDQSALKNQSLSVDRATAVSSYLQSLGVPTSQIKSVNGFGQDNPVADNSTAAGQAQNRRVEIIMYASQKMIQAAENGTLH